MIVKSKNVQRGRVSQEKAVSALKSHLKYLQYRERHPERESKETRVFFDATRDNIDRRAVVKELIQKEQTGGIYYHRMMLSPAPDEPVNDWKVWTRAVLCDLSQRLGKTLSWYAMYHANTDNPHIHLVISGTAISYKTRSAVPVTFTPQDFKFLRARGREHSEYEQYRFLTATLRDIEKRDDISKEAPRTQRESVIGERGIYDDLDH
ncbi:hypothetical protein [Thermogemmatispora sp.]|uniref:hypothetical protein n=1 Tax=Thermogemmatispora sp. TaxID=1968838 RepID=UPI002ACBFB24|nr:hypothetical protein [Thermogemmatispora sp.]